MAKYISLFGGTTTDTTVQVVKENQIVIGYGPYMSMNRYVVYKVEYTEDGYMYHLLNLDTKKTDRTDILQPLSRKHGIGRYYDDVNPQFMDTFEVALLVEEAEKQAAEEARQTEQERQRVECVKVVGRERFAALLPPTAKAVIVAELRQDESDHMTDYFAYRTVRTVILGFSSHTRDLFPEMRKCAANFPETAYLAEANEEYERREKYSMGAGYYRRFDEQKGTQFVFSDLGTYKGGSDWNVYSEIKRKLVEDYGIPPSEVRFIQEATTEKSRKAMITDMNAGRIRVLFGSTEMLGTGVNAQKRCVAIHHLDSPWRPSDLEQRDGRGIRTGNEVAKYHANNKVDVILYAVEKSLDAYKFGLLHNKQLFIRQLKTNNMGSRTIDEGAIDEKSGMNFSEYVAILSGNTDLLEKARLEKKIATLESERQAFVRGKSSSRYKLDTILSTMKKNDAKIEGITKDLEHFKARVQLNGDGSYRNPVKLDGLETSDPKLIGKQLNHIADASGERIVIGRVETQVKSESGANKGIKM